MSTAEHRFQAVNVDIVRLSITHLSPPIYQQREAVDISERVGREEADPRPEAQASEGIVYAYNKSAKARSKREFSPKVV